MLRQVGADIAWRIVLAASRHAERLTRAGECAAFSFDEGGARLCPVHPDDPAAVLAWRPGAGWKALLPEEDPGRALIDLYAPMCSATPERPLTVGHLGQSLDGFIATHAGESRFVTGQENIRHMHRLRALCDAVVVGAGTVAFDDPQLTTRLVLGSNPLRVVIDPARRLGGHHRVFNDGEADTLYVCAQSHVRAGDHHVGLASVVGIPEAAGGEDGADGSGTFDVEVLMRELRARGCARVFVEGGGVTVSMFLQANLLDRLHVAIAPLIIGDGRPAIRLRPRALLGDCHRPRYRVFRMGGDVLFDFDLRGGDAGASDPADADPPITRII